MENLLTEYFNALIISKVNFLLIAKTRYQGNRCSDRHLKCVSTGLKVEALQKRKSKMF